VWMPSITPTPCAGYTTFSPTLNMPVISSWPPEDVRMSLRILSDDPSIGQRTAATIQTVQERRASGGPHRTLQQHLDFLVKVAPPPRPRDWTPPPASTCWLAVTVDTPRLLHAKLDRARGSLAVGS